MNFEDMSDVEILDIAIPIMDNLMEASTRSDYEAHVRDFSDRMKNSCDERVSAKSVSTVPGRERLLC
jgi:hypothetical protein